MKNEIVTNIDTPEKLERLYRRDKFQFEDWLVEAIKMFPNSETLRPDGEIRLYFFEIVRYCAYGMTEVETDINAFFMSGVGDLLHID